MSQEKQLAPPYYLANLRKVLLIVNKQVIEMQTVYENENWCIIRKHYLQKYIEEEGKFLHSDPHKMESQASSAHSIHFVINDDVVQSKIVDGSNYAYDEMTCDDQLR